MPLEPNFRWIDDLNPANPNDDGPVNQGDDHLRGTKSALQGSVAGNATTTTLKANGQPALIAKQTGAEVKAEGPVDGVLEVGNADQTLASIIGQVVGNLIVRAELAGAGVDIVARDTGGIERALISGDPDGKTDINFAGDPKISTAADGGQVTGVLRVTETTPSDPDELSSKQYVDEGDGSTLSAAQSYADQVAAAEAAQAEQNANDYSDSLAAGQPTIIVGSNHIYIDNVLLQWGRETYSTQSNRTVTFPISYDDVPRVVIAGRAPSNNQFTNHRTDPSSTSTTTFRYYNFAGYTYTDWIAIGIAAPP